MKRKKIKRKGSSQMFIYKIYHPSSDKIYIGKTEKSLHSRLNKHIRSAYKERRTKIQRWILKIAQKGLRPEIVEIEKVYPSNWEQREKHWIKHYRRTLGKDMVLNIQSGGQNPPRMTADKIKPVSDIARKRMSRYWKNYYKTHAGFNLGKKASKETREKISKASIGRTPPNKGLRMSRTFSKQLSERQKKIKNQQDINKIYDMYWRECFSQDEIAKVFNISRGIISRLIYQKNGYKYTGKPLSKKEIRQVSQRYRLVVKKQDEVNKIYEKYWNTKLTQKQVADIFQLDRGVISNIVLQKKGYKYTGDLNVV